MKLHRAAAVLLLLVALMAWLGFRHLIAPWPLAPAKLNIFIITIDSLRPGHLSAYGYGRPTSPNLERLAREGVRFDRVINQASWTNAALISMWTSRYPSVHGVEGRSDSFPAGALSPLHLLRNAGYATPGISYLTQTPNYANLGFQPTRERDPLAWLDAHPQRPFFLWLHLTGPHLPYDPKPASLARFDPDGRIVGGANPAVLKTLRQEVIIKRGTLRLGEAERRAIAALYDAEVLEEDAEIGRYLEGLRARGLEDSTLVIVGADHGEELGDHGHVGHASTSLAGTLYQEVIQVPLIMRLPGVLPRGARVPHLVEGVDLMPTLFDLLRLPPLPWRAGRSLLPLLFDRRPAWEHLAFAETTPCGFQCPEGDQPRLRMLQSPRWKYIQTARGQVIEREELYDLEADAQETRDLAARQPQVRAQFAARLQVIRAANEEQRHGLLPPPGAVPPAEDGGGVVVLAPKPGEVLTFAATGGRIVVRLGGEPGSRYRIQYDIGEETYRVRGELHLEGGEHIYGPFSPALWLRFLLYNPWRFRVAREGSSHWSAWISFRLAS
ncbi:MAG: sulfatase [Candidatus Tectomicrobia bacterium]|nr:sulfatase [Candidatus Tectomicrobia bacterium]